MYKVVLVDDERLILEGIKAIVNWNAAGTELVGTARNGIEAMELIACEKPDIVITDIRMPGMDGLQLVQRVRENDEEGPEFIVLSGFNDFNFAKAAMRYGVKHYLLKPCNEGVIEQALQEVAAELDKRRGREHFLSNMESELSKVIPHAKAQFLKELVTNKTYGRRDWEDYARLFQLTLHHGQVRLLLIQVEGSYEYEHLFALLNIAEDLLGPELTLLGTTMGKHVLLLLSETPELDRLYMTIDEIKRIFTAYYKLDATAALSDPDEITGARRMYKDTLTCLEYRFYLGEGSLITKKDIEFAGRARQDSFDYDEDRICLLVKSGRWSDAEQELTLLFDGLAQQRLDTAVTKSYVIPIYVAVIRQGDPQQMNRYLQALSKMDGMDTLSAVRDFVIATAKEVCLSNYEQYKSKHSDMIERMLEVIESNLSNPQLSLHWVASEILYMNADYLGKLFKKEVGDKFSAYVTKRRMEQAITLIGQMEDVRVFELAERLGFGDNPQYFSQVFKKYTGCSPSEFKRPNS